jgi:two-component system sensor histidine kinase BarA
MSDLIAFGQRPAGATRVIALAPIGDAALEWRKTALADAILRRPLVQNELRPVLDRLSRGECLDAEYAHSSRERETLSRFAAAHVLVADDSEVNQEVACEALKQLGIDRVTVVGDGVAACNAAIATKFDIILMDGSMPELDGFQSARRIRAHELETGAKRTPIVALTAHVAGSSAEAWRDAGMDAILHKPFTVKKLAECIGAFLAADLAQEADETVAPAPLHAPTQQARDEEALLDAPAIADLLQTAQSGRRDFIDRIVGLYRSHAPRVLADLRAAAERNDASGVGAAAHSLKSMSLNMGVGRLAARLAGIEAAARNSRTIPAVSELDELRDLAEATINEIVRTFAPGEPARLSA